MSESSGRSQKPTPEHKFRVVYADPPWPTNQQGARGASQHYSLMSLRDIVGMGNAVKHLAAANSTLLLWVTNSDLQAGLDVMKAWGYRYVTNAVWDKYYMGLGNYFRGSHEILLHGIRGKAPFRFHGQRSMLQFPRTEHSRKPDEMFPLIERVLPGPYLELFARRQPNTRGDWSVWGNEVDSDVSLLPFGYPVPSDSRNVPAAPSEVEAS
jgi:N6-adenosine-specific RNA methylase IME4